ncbi:FGGY-family carbohydrate kinase [Aureimonas fodinaquatilis]|uniref:FGGY-family carbohydrate kinase n=1 Tax=Aureimonas fodinaquatilis TaxID=2565783 RepID=A0A5B0E0Z7_9HYPH|nr:FGGY-family carbohydrate kinase [Aureimonas fodinaquatilis]KAA0971631.1 FGGY-family carbohydrate kinase [Aureimonas fodinaquatilis]
MSEAFIGVDVGTGSARAGVFDRSGTLLGSAKRDITLWRGEHGIVEQSSANIWQAVVQSVREAVDKSGVAAEAVKGIGFDATCSLVVIGPDGEGLPVGPSEDSQRDIIVWMDHRALDQTRRINQTGHPVLRYVGGVISPEMETPKLLWLKENRPHIFAAAEHFFDLADYLSWRATGSLARSVCTVTCKWTYLAHERRWDADYFRTIGLEELADENFARIGADVVGIGEPLANGLTEQAAADLGLVPGTAVGAPAIDAHAGGIGTLGADGRDPSAELAFIMGTSSCAMAVTRQPAFVDGVWGPYYDSLLPDYWLLEGGQSAYGAGLDYLVSLHPASAAMAQEAASQGLSLLGLLERRAIEMAGSVENAATLARDIHIVPEFLGNRSPEADPAATAVISGLTLDNSEAGLVRLFVAGLCGLSYGTGEIVRAMREKGVELGAIVVSGGAARSQLLRRILSDATNMRVVLPVTPEPVLLGSAIIGAVGARSFADIAAAASAMCAVGEETLPQADILEFHTRKKRAYDILRNAERQVRKLT